MITNSPTPVKLRGQLDLEFPFILHTMTGREVKSWSKMLMRKNRGTLPNIITGVPSILPIPPDSQIKVLLVYHLNFLRLTAQAIHKAIDLCIPSSSYLLTPNAIAPYSIKLH